MASLINELQGAWDVCVQEAELKGPGGTLLKVKVEDVSSALKDDIIAFYMKMAAKIF